MTKAISMQDLSRVDGLQDLLEADVVLAVDTENRSDLVVFGRQTLAKAVENGQEPELKMLVVELDTSSEELGRLRALIIYLRGDPHKEG
jgi:hypothetical protein